MVWLALSFMLACNAGCANPTPLLSNAGYTIDRSHSHVRTLKELREERMFVQRFDYSCGAAALATLMRYYFDDDVSEKSLLEDIRTTLTPDEYARVEEDGLSFFELEEVSRSRGYQAVSVRLELSALVQLRGPVLVYVEPDGYRHFAILRGVVEDRVFLADPSRGNIRMSVDEFATEWSGETLILGKPGFGLPEDQGLAIELNPGFRHELTTARQATLIRSVIRVPR